MKKFNAFGSRHTFGSSYRKSTLFWFFKYLAARIFIFKCCALFMQIRLFTEYNDAANYLRI